jgi:plasmid stabilization system protein ParE
MSKPIILSPLSQKDFESILDYLNTNWGNKVVLDFLDRVELLLKEISDHPKLFPFVNKKKRVHKRVLSKHNTIF